MKPNPHLDVLSLDEDFGAKGPPHSDGICVVDESVALAGNGLARLEPGNAGNGTKLRELLEKENRMSGKKTGKKKH